MTEKLSQIKRRITSKEGFVDYLNGSMKYSRTVMELEKGAIITVRKRNGLYVTLTKANGDKPKVSSIGRTMKHSFGSTTEENIGALDRLHETAVFVIESENKIREIFNSPNPSKTHHLIRLSQNSFLSRDSILSVGIVPSAATVAISLERDKTNLVGNYFLASKIAKEFIKREKRRELLRKSN